MKQITARSLQRILALVCAFAMIITLLPLSNVRADETFTYDLHSKIKDGTIARPGQAIQALCDEPDYESYCKMNFFVDGKQLEDITVWSYYVSDGATIPAWEGIDYWKASYSSVEVSDITDNFGNAVKVYSGMVNFFGVWLQENNNENGNNNGNDNSNVTSGYDAAPNEDQFYDYWEDVIRQNAQIDFGQFETTNELSANNDIQQNPRWADGNPQQNVFYVATEVESDITATPVPDDEKPRGPVNPDNDPEPSPEPTAEPTPTEEPRGPVNPDDTPTPEPPTATPTATPVPTRVPVVTAEPTPIPVPKVVTTPLPTPVVVQEYVPPVPTGTVEVIAQVKEPQHFVYNIGIEVGRNAKITTGNKTNSSKKSSNTKIIHDPYEDVGTFDTNKFQAKAMWPGDATLTFKGSEGIEEWNVHVYCRPLDFEQTQYVTVKPKKDYGYITLYLKYFEYSSEFAYDFQWSSSNKDVAIVYGGDPSSTFCRFRVQKEGVTVISVKDKYGNESKTVLIVKPDESKPSTEKEDNGKKEDTSKQTDINSLSKKKAKALVKKTAFDTGLKIKSGKIVYTWTPATDSKLGKLDGYEVQYSTSKKFKNKTSKKIKKGTTVKYTFKSPKDGKTYYFRVRGYKNWNGTKIYTDWSASEKIKFKK